MTSPSVLALLQHMKIDPGAGAPARVPAKSAQAPHGDTPNATLLQKLITPNIQEPARTVFDRTRFSNFNIVSLALPVAGVDVLILNRPSQLRVSLFIRNAIASAGVINIAFDVPAFGAGVTMELPAGGMVLFDEFVPQNDIHVSAITATSFVAVTYCDASYP